MDLTAIRADLKVWEKAFKAREGRDPSKADIKANPEIAEKYRVYSKSRLDKGTAAAVPVAAAPSRTVPITPTKQRVASTSTPTSRGVQGDIFKTPSRRDGSASKASAPANGATEFAYAPSPSRLRALAASRSFSGSPNRKASSAVEEFEASVAASPRNLGRSFILPPAVDTPRTKARKWLAGDAVSPPVKAKLAANASRAASEAASGSSAVQAKKKRANGNFWEQVEREKQEEQANDINNGDDFGMDASAVSKRTADDDDFLAPSPAKPVNGKGKGKAKQRQFIDLFEGGQEGSAEVEEPLLRKRSAVPSSSTTQPAISMQTQKAQVATSSFFASSSSTSIIAKPNGISHTLTASAVSTSYVAGPSKPKKRSSTAAALAPFDRLGEEDAISPRATSEDVTKQIKGKGTVAEEMQETKRPRREVAKRKVPQIVEDEVEQDLSNGTTEQDEDEEAMRIMQEQEREELKAENADEAVEDYEIQNLSDEYEPYKPHSRRSATPHLDPHISQKASRAGSAVPELDDSLDPHLVSLLSLKTSPVKNRLAKLHKKREETVSKLLMEPTYLIAQKKEQAKKGLEDLEDDEDLIKTGWKGDREDDDEALASDVEDDEQEEARAENSDDDWASEPEGWKDLGDGEMDSLD